MTSYHKLGAESVDGESSESLPVASRRGPLEVPNKNFLRPPREDEESWKAY